MAINQTFIDFQGTIPADWLNNVNAFVNYSRTNSAATLRQITSGTVAFVQTDFYATLGDSGQGTYWYDAAASTYTLAVPSNIQLSTSTTGGILAAGTYSYRVAAIDESGVTQASTAVTINTTGATSTVTVTWNPVPNAFAYNIYGRSLGAETLFVQIPAGTLTWTDDGGITAGLYAPSSTAWQWDNGGSRIQANDGGRYHLMVSGSQYFIEQFGGSVNSTDNSPAINAAINAAWCNGGGDIRFRAGTYTAGQIFLQTNVNLYGIGCDHSGHFSTSSNIDTKGTTLKLKSGLNPGNGFLVSPLYVHSHKLVGLNIDGNASGNPTTSTCVYVVPGYPNSDFSNQQEDLYLTIEHCSLYNASTFGLYAGPQGRGGRIFNSYIFSNLGDGIRIQTSDWTVQNCLFGLNYVNLNLLGAVATHITGCDIFTPTENGGAPNTGVNVNINDSTFFGGPVSCDGIWFTSCEFDYAAQHSVQIFGSATTGIVFQGCRWNSSSINHNNQYSHLAIGASVANGGVTLNNCEFDVGAPPNLAQYDILFATPGAQYIYVSNNNHISGSNVSGVTNSAASCRMYASNTTQSFLDYRGLLSAQMSASADPHQLVNTTSTENTLILNVGGGTNSSAIFATTNLGGYSGFGAGLYVGKNSTTNRSINAGGTINASGADYAEYMMKSPTCGEIQKGDIVGVNADGLLTDKYSEAVSFVVKSSNPSLVGNDIYTLEERDQIDRIAFAGQVPINFTSGSAGDYVIGAPGDNDSIVPAIGGHLHLEAVGKIKNFGPDGRAIIFVKVV